MQEINAIFLKFLLDTFVEAANPVEFKGPIKSKKLAESKRLVEFNRLAESKKSKAAKLADLRFYCLFIFGSCVFVLEKVR